MRTITWPASVTVSQGEWFDRWPMARLALSCAIPGARPFSDRLSWREPVAAPSVASARSRALTSSAGPPLSDPWSWAA